MTLSIVTPPTLQPVNRMVPTGGVMVPTELHSFQGLCRSAGRLE